MINKLVENIKKTNAPIVVGLDPTLAFVPEHVQKKAFAEYGETLEGAAEAIWQFNRGLIDALCDIVPAVKPQAAYYENLGYEKGLCPQAERYYQEVMSLPLYSSLTDRDVEDVIRIVEKLVSYYAK